MKRSHLTLLLALAALGWGAAQSSAQTAHDHHGHREGDHHGHGQHEGDHSEMDHSERVQHDDHSEMDHSEHGQQDDDSQMDHSEHGQHDDHSEMNHSAEAGSIPRTPATAAIEPYFDSPEMDRARAQARREMGGGRFLMLQADRLEWRSGEGDAVALFEGQGWYGGDMHRFWFKADSELLLDAPAGEEDFEEAELQALYSRPISPYFDLQVGVRHDVEPSPSRTFAVIGVQGLAPHWFEVDLALFVSEDGDLSSRLEAEYDMLFTQKLMLQFRAELDLVGSAVPELGLGSGLSSAEAGLRLSYGRVFAPYVGVEWERKFGATADFARADGEEADSVSAVVGLRAWY